ncbi:hypothetical protein QR685DRAFT_81934 [Neurospora intermedia]|uniref:Secreted protein n=1 Tax=Neurospora intermedia TaxID=5142 RepID=A0ABR3D6B1_NEUIN
MLDRRRLIGSLSLFIRVMVLASRLAFPLPSITRTITVVDIRDAAHLLDINSCSSHPYPSPRRRPTSLHATLAGLKQFGSRNRHHQPAYHGDHGPLQSLQTEYLLQGFGGGVHSFCVCNSR